MRNIEADTVSIDAKPSGILREDDHETERDRETEGYKLAATQLV